jgi:hypothetical protein
MLLAAGRQQAILAAVEAHNRIHQDTPLPRQAARLLTIMFSDRDECSRSLDDLAAEGFGRNALPKVLRALIEVGLVSRQRGSARIPNAYRLCLPMAGGEA